MSNKSGEFSVLDMASEYAATNDIDTSDLFKKETVKAEPELIEDQNHLGAGTSTDGGEGTSGSGGSGIDIAPVEKGAKKPWTPDASLIEGMSDITAGPVIYSKDELKEDAPEDLKNIADDNALQSSRETMDELTRKGANIEDAKKRFGIKKLQVPEGPFQVRIFAAAGDTNYIRSKQALDGLFQEIVTSFPEFVLEWSDPSKDPRNKKDASPVQDTPTEVCFDAGATVNDAKEFRVDTAMKASLDESAIVADKADNESDAKIVINKTNLPEVSWTKEEMDKIKKSRSIELNIVEDVELKYSNIEDLDDNSIDVVLSQYQRKVNDVFAALPASKYRATFTGLTYTEILDLSHSQEMNSLDGERKKWSIAFDHIKNQSIGPWEEYTWYIDPTTKSKVKLPIEATSNPHGVDMQKHTKFNDFLSKTSYLDLEYILWKILCASAMDKEIISIDCHANFKGSPCNKSYDWLYSPKELLMMGDIDPAVLEEMKKTTDVNNIEDIIANFKESMLNTNNNIELPNSKFGVVFGHISAYDYLNSVYGEIHALEDDENVLVSEAISRSMLTVIKSFIIPNGKGGYSRVKGTKGIVKIINILDEVDFQTISELMRIMIHPYQFRYALRDICCPQCKNKSSIAIESMTRLLFIVAQSLSNVQVVLKRT